MKTKDIRGMRDAPTHQGLGNRSVPSTREQIMTELARLEHERARLEREISMWIDNRKKAEGRLQRVAERIALLEQAMDESSAKHRPSSADGRSRGSREQENVIWQEIPLEY